MKITNESFDFFKKIVGAAYVKQGESDLEAYGRDWTRMHKPCPQLVVLPKTTSEVSQLVGHCYEHGYPIVPSGGRTGMAGGAVACQGEVVLSLERMNQVLEVDSVGLTITAQAGVVTEKLQIAAQEVGLQFPIDLGAKGSCLIGGNIATNAGGLKFIRYGGTRDHVLGLEVVLADGQVLDMDSHLHKNNTGYDLKQLFIGAEGTLGVITKATLRLMPPPMPRSLGMFGASDFDAIYALLKHARQANGILAAFEFFSDKAHAVVKQHMSGTRRLFEKEYPYYALIELESSDREAFETFFSKAYEDGAIEDALIASSTAEEHELWMMREGITESLSATGHVRKADISVPVKSLKDFVAEVEALDSRGEISIVLFGHVGDGNVHINLHAPVSMGKSDFDKESERIEKLIFQLVSAKKGSISAEHGIGLLKRDDLHLTRSTAEIDWMRKVKQVLDPRGIFNPGKIF